MASRLRFGWTADATTTCVYTREREKKEANFEKKKTEKSNRKPETSATSVQGGAGSCVRAGGKAQCAEVKKGEGEGIFDEVSREGKWRMERENRLRERPAPVPANYTMHGP